MIQSKYNQIIEHIKDLAEKGFLEEGSELPSENELAKTLNVSRVTVRNAYRKLCEFHWITKEKGKRSRLCKDAFGIKAERRVVRKKIAAIFPELNNYFGVVLQELNNSAKYYGYDLIVGINGDVKSEQNSVLSAIENRVSGVIITPIRYYNNYSLENYLLLKSKNVPLVMVGKPPVQMVCDAVYANDVLGAYNATKKLLGAADAVCHVTSKNMDLEAISERKEGFLRACEPSEKPWLLLERTDLDYREKLASFVSENKTVGFLLSDGSMMSDLHGLCVRQNKTVGQDVLIIGYDSLKGDPYTARTLSVMDLDRKQQGRQAMNLMNTLLKMFNGKATDTIATHITITPRLIQRESFRELDGGQTQE